VSDYHEITAYLRNADDLELKVSFEYEPYQPACHVPGLLQPESPPDVNIYQITLDDFFEVSAVLNPHAVEDIRKQCFEYMEKVNDY